MPSLLDTIRQNSAAMNIPKQGVTDQTAQTATLLRAKKGKAATGPDLGASNLGEQAAVAETNTQIQNEVAPAAALQQAGAEQAARAETQATQLQKADIAQNRRADTVQDRIKTEQLLQDFEQDRGKLDLQKNTAQVNQFAQNLRLSNDKYVNDLKREGARARLDDEQSFLKSLQKEIFDNDEELLGKQQENQTVANMSDREWNKQMAQMGIDQAWSTFRNNQKAEKDRAIWTGLGTVAGIGGGMAGQKMGAAGSGGGGVSTGATTEGVTQAGPAGAGAGMIA